MCIFNPVTHKSVICGAVNYLFTIFWQKTFKQFTQLYLHGGGAASHFLYIAILLSLPIKTYIKNPIGQSPAHTRSINIANVRRRWRITSLSKIKVSNSISLIVSLYMYVYTIRGYAVSNLCSHNFIQTRSTRYQLFIMQVMARGVCFFDARAPDFKLFVCLQVKHRSNGIK